MERKRNDAILMGDIIAKIGTGQDGKYSARKFEI